VLVAITPETLPTLTNFRGFPQSLELNAGMLSLLRYGLSNPSSTNHPITNPLLLNMLLAMQRTSQVSLALHVTKPVPLVVS